MGSNGIVEGGGFRFSYNPLESYDFYGFVDTPNGVGTHRTEGGIYVNSGIVESVAVIAIAGGYIITPYVKAILQLISKIPLLNAIGAFIQEIFRLVKASILFYILNGEINKNSCDSEET